MQGSSVDEERRGAGNADAITLINIMLHRGFMDTVCQASGELYNVESDLRSVSL